MKKLMIVLALAGCTERADYSKGGQVVVIEGREFFVEQVKWQKSNVYVGVPNVQSGSALFKRDFTLPPLNVAAIEKATGCKVIPSTIENDSTGNTFAAVEC